MKKRTLLLLLSLASCSLGQSKQIVPDFHYEEGVPSLTQNGDIDPRLEDFDLNEVNGKPIHRKQRILLSLCRLLFLQPLQKN